MQTDDPGVLEIDAVEVGSLGPEDLDWVTQIDRQSSGRSRRAYFELKLKEAAQNTGIRVSLAARIDGEPAGFLMGRLYYGEFGQPEPAAVLDSIAVAPAFRGKHVGRALMRQLQMNLNALGIDRLQTKVDWDQLDLLAFFQKLGFTPAARLCLEMPVESVHDEA